MKRYIFSAALILLFGFAVTTQAVVTYGTSALIGPGGINTSHILDSTIVNADVSSTSFFDFQTLAIGTTTPNGALNLWWNGGSTTPMLTVSNTGSTTPFTLLSNGYIGVGTTSPGFPLAIEGSANIANALTANVLSATSTMATSTLAGGTSFAGGALRVTNTGVVLGDAIGPHAVFSSLSGMEIGWETNAVHTHTTWTNGVIQNIISGTELSRWNANGLGIGTSTFPSLLTVNGNGFFSGALTASSLTATGTIAVNSTSATSTFANGINMSGGCFFVSGNCLTKYTPSASSTSYTTAGTYTWVRPAGITKVTVTVIGGGAGTADSACTADTASEGGGGGGYAHGVVTVSGNVTVTVGAGGAGGTLDATCSSGTQAGSAGGNSSFAGDQTITANGGSGGTGGGTTVPNGVAGITGQTGRTGLNATEAKGGDGGDTPLGFGGYGASSNGDGENGLKCGGGGGGAATSDTTNNNGGNGANGCVIVEWME